MNGGNSLSQLEVEKLVGENYNYWKLSMEAYLQGQDLWDLVFGAYAVILEDTPQNDDLHRRWKIKCGKVLFSLRTYINREYIQHDRDMKSPKEVWETLEKLFTQKNTTRLKYLENELARMVQGNMWISEYFF